VDPERARELLRAERERIERALADTRPADDGELTTQDEQFADYATNLYQEEFDEGLAEQLQGELEALERAEARLADGTYGLSIESGVPIPDERLEALPTAERTAEEEERFERGA
jgi:DnaK suppressor protein